MGGINLQCFYNLPDIYINETGTTHLLLQWTENFSPKPCVVTNILGPDDKWNLLLCNIAYHIKNSAPFVNSGFKDSGADYTVSCLFKMNTQLATHLSAELHGYALVYHSILRNNQWMSSASQTGAWQQILPRGRKRTKQRSVVKF